MLKWWSLYQYQKNICSRCLDIIFFSGKCCWMIHSAISEYLKRKSDRTGGKAEFCNTWFLFQAPTNLPCFPPNWIVCPGRQIHGSAHGQWSTHSSNSSVFNRWKFPTLKKVIHPSETLVGWRYFLIFPSGPSFFLRNCHAGKGREGAGVHFPPGQQINSKKISHKWALQ